MFDNATMFMMFILLCFAGLLVMFYFVLRGMEELARGMRDEHAALASGLRTLETRVNELARAQRAVVAGLPPTPRADAGGDAFEEPAGQYHVQYGTGPDARIDAGYGAGDDPLYGLVQEDAESDLPGGLGMDFEEPVELVDRQPADVPGLRYDDMHDGGSARVSRAADLHEVELPSLDLSSPAKGVSGASRGRTAGLDTSALDASSLDAFGGPDRGDRGDRGDSGDRGDRGHDDHEPQPAPRLSSDTGGTGLLSFGDDEAAYREARERRAEARASRGKGGLPDLKLDD